MFGIFRKNSIPKIAKVLPPALVEQFEMQNFYSVEEVKSVFENELKTEHNLEYAFAMFCSQCDYEKLNLVPTYNELRSDVSKKCFSSWPRFNFQSLLDYSRCSTKGGNVGSSGGGDGYSDGGSGDGGCGGGGE